MRQLFAAIYIIPCIGHLIFELVKKSFQNGLEAILTMGITAIFDGRNALGEQVASDMSSLRKMVILK